MLEAKQMAQKLISQFQSNDPFKIADSLDYIVIFVPLCGIRGFHQYIRRNHIIYIDSSLDEVQQRWVCAHELGHIFLHPHLNRMFMANHTYSVQSRYEVEADRFAACLCYPELLEEFEGYSSAQIAEVLHLPLSLIEYAMKE
nr:MAG TPA: IrrE protein [Caudoviricetes sp.]